MSRSQTGMIIDAWTRSEHMERSTDQQAQEIYVTEQVAYSEGISSGLSFRIQFSLFTDSLTTSVIET